jgi:hypothetical protein
MTFSLCCFFTQPQEIRNKGERKSLHEIDMKNGFDTVYLPQAIERKFINVKYEWGGNMYFLHQRFQLTQVQEFKEDTIFNKQFTNNSRLSSGCNRME